MSTSQDLHKIANLLRADVLQMVYLAGAGHIAGPLSSADLMAVLYFGGVADLDKDKVVLSCGHYCPVLYAALARSDRFPVKELATFMKIGSRLPGHPERGLTPGVEVSAGPLGQGVSVATGMALGMRMEDGNQSPKVYCLLSDGELQEGQVWEVFNFAVAQKLDNIIYFVDRNKVQIEHYVKELVATKESHKLEAFGLHVIEVDGNDIDKLRESVLRAKKVVGEPVVIVMDTIAGKGVSFMENEPKWHDKVPTKDELELALKELDVQR